MRALTPVVIAMLVASACTFGHYARRNQFGFHVTLEDARALDDAELIADLESLGASTDYNAATLDVARCLDEYTQGLKDKREYEATGVVRDDWFFNMRGCHKHCTTVVEMKSAEPSSARDLALASKYRERCDAESAVAKGLIDAGIIGEATARAEQALSSARTHGKTGCFIAVDFHLRQAAFELRELSDDQSAPMRATIEEARRTFARGLERVARYKSDARVRALTDQERSLQTEIQELETRGEHARDAKHRRTIAQRLDQLDAKLEKLGRRRRAMTGQFGIPCSTPL